MEYVAYILRDSRGKLYKGMTSDIAARLSRHRSGHVTTTARMNDVRVVYLEKFDNFEDARKREKYFKTAAGRRFLKQKGL